MPFYELDTLGNSLKKYAIIAIIAGGIGMYKGCDVGRDMGRKDIMKEMYSIHQQARIADIDQAAEDPTATKRMLEEIMKGE